MAFKLKIKTGSTAPAVGALDIGELGFSSGAASDARELYIGLGAGQAAVGFYNKAKIDTLLGNKTDIGHVHSLSDVSGLTTALAGKVSTSRQVIAGTSLTGGGALTADVTISHSNVTRSDSGTPGTKIAVTNIASNEQGHLTSVTFTDWTSVFAAYDANGYVSKAGNETIAGVKTFTSIPVLPGTNPTLPAQAASKAYVDSVAQGLSAKQSVLLASDNQIALSGSGNLTVDGKVAPHGSRILLKDQINATQNGIYYIDGTPDLDYTLVRTTDMPTNSNANSAFVFVENGDTYSGTGWVVTGSDTVTDNIVTVGTDNIIFTQFSGAGSTIVTGTSPIVVTQDGNNFEVGHLGTAGNKHIPTGGATGQALIYGAASGTAVWGTPNVAFTDLTDTPANYTGAGSKLVAVNSGATALEFVNTLDCGTY